MRKIVFIGLLAIGIILISGCLEPTQKGCPLIAKVCPDGSTVGPVPPDCEFAPCPISEEKYCEKDSDCACGVHINTGECFYGNKNYVNTEKQCPDFCTGIGGNLIIKCINNQCQAIEEEKECIIDDDCGTGGCSGQICGLKDKVKGIITTCEWREEYGCYQKTTCSCINGKCQWKETNEFLDCMKAAKSMVEI